MDSMLPRVSTEIYHRWRQNGEWTSVTHSSAPCEPPFVFTFDVICDLLLNITYDNMESISVNWKSDFSVTQKLDSNLPSFAALTFGVIVIGGAFVVKYVGTMVLQVCFCITVSSIADFFFNSRYHARLSLWQLRPLFVTRRFSNLSVSGRGLGPGHLFTDST